MSTAPQYLYRKPSGVYHLSIRVPSDLQSILDIKWIRRSLKTSNLQDATILLNTHLSKLKSSFTLLRTGVLDVDQIIALKASLVPCKPLENKTNTSLSLGELIDKYILEHSVNWAASTTKSFTNKFEAMKNVLSNEVKGMDINSYNRDSDLPP